MGICPVVIPSLEPDTHLTRLLEELGEMDIGPVVVVDDGSGRKYEDIFEAAARRGAVILKHEINMGKGRALKTAFDYCIGHYDGIIGVVTADSDGQHSPGDIKRCMEALEANEHSLILGARDFDMADVPDKSRIGNKLARGIFRVICGRRLQDVQTGLRAIPVDFCRELLTLKQDRFEFENEMLLRALRDGMSIVEIPISTIYDSKDNHVSHYRPFRDSVRIAATFAAPFFRFMISGLSSFVLDLGLFYLFCALLRGSGVFYVTAATIGARIISACYNYLVNYFFVFRSRKRHREALTGYITLAAVQMLLSALLTTLLVSVIGGTGELLVKIPVDALLFLINYRIQNGMVY